MEVSSQAGSPQRRTLRRVCELGNTEQKGEAKGRECFRRGQSGGGEGAVSSIQWQLEVEKHENEATWGFSKMKATGDLPLSAQFSGEGIQTPPFHRRNAKDKFNNYMCGVKSCYRHIKKYSLTQEMILQQQVGWSQSLEVLVPREGGLESIWQ